MSRANEPCLACRVVSGAAVTAGGIVWRGAHVTVHALAERSPLAGWLVATTNRHARAIYDLDDREAAALGRAVARVARAQRQALGAEHVYVLALGDVLHHCHVHLVPRYADTPQRLRGRGAFDASPEDLLPDPLAADAAGKVREALGPSAGA